MVDTNRVKGALDKAKGAVKEGVGDLTGDKSSRPRARPTRSKAKLRERLAGSKTRSEALLARRKWREWLATIDRRPLQALLMEEFEMGLLEPGYRRPYGWRRRRRVSNPRRLDEPTGRRSIGWPVVRRSSRKPGDRWRPCRHTLWLPTGGLRTYRTIMVGNGPNQAVSPQQLQNVFGNDQVQSMANQSGMAARLLDAAQSASTKCCKRPHPQWKAAGRRSVICVILPNELVVGCLSSTVLLGNTWRSAFSRVFS